LQELIEARSGGRRRDRIEYHTNTSVIQWKGWPQLPAAPKASASRCSSSTWMHYVPFTNILLFFMMIPEQWQITGHGRLCGWLFHPSLFLKHSIGRLDHYPYKVMNKISACSAASLC